MEAVSVHPFLYQSISSLYYSVPSISLYLFLYETPPSWINPLPRVSLFHSCMSTLLLYLSIPPCFSESFVVSVNLFLCQSTAFYITLFHPYQFILSASVNHLYIRPSLPVCVYSFLYQSIFYVSVYLILIQFLTMCSSPYFQYKSIIYMISIVLVQLFLYLSFYNI